MIPLNHAASATAYQADVTGAQASPLGVDIFSVVKPGDRDQIVFEQNAEPAGLYCGDETDGDSSAIASRSTTPCTPTRSAGPRRSRAWPPRAPRTRT